MSLLWFFIFSVLSIIIYYVFYRRTNDAMNPVGMMIFVFTFLAGICHLNLGEFQRPWCVQTYYLILLSIVTMFVTGLFAVDGIQAKRRFERNPIGICWEDTQRYMFKRWVFFLCVLSFICSLITIFENGLSFTYILHNSLHGNKGNWQMSSVSIIEYFANMLPALSVACYFFLCFSNSISLADKIFIWFIIVYSLLYTIMVMVSRGTVIILIMGCVYIRHRKKHFNVSGVMKVFLIIALLFGVFALLRWSEHNTSLSVYTGRTNSFIFNSVYNYVVYCYQNFDTLVRHGSPKTLMMYNLAPLAKLFGIYQESKITYLSVGGFNACIFLTGAFHDLGVFGVVLYSFIDVIIVAALYNLSNIKEVYSICLGFLQRGIMVLFFAEYIFLLNGQSLFLFIMLPLIFFTSRMYKFVFTLRRL